MSSLDVLLSILSHPFLLLPLHTLAAQRSHMRDGGANEQILVFGLCTAVRDTGSFPAGKWKIRGKCEAK
ncbi:hypothetical protein GGTG_02241 [Gaeumannomyces tritici R3-111a-1]|uniref:Secreted protein n=1 Tax=Gaeumannomyces tritici (strain R3-111a-1) TaxID=644352 RepID=J3NLU1_GAET3|nr:hypothetical protein GGTG_02241 [Gaeumannomyces tritici R3-111a-1]EJT82267.1 hypothetical protein GGTG_02241 [Gaeumannomyces tritici R3-111a-1]